MHDNLLINMFHEHPHICYCVLHERNFRTLNLKQKITAGIKIQHSVKCHLWYYYIGSQTGGPSGDVYGNFKTAFTKLLRSYTLLKAGNNIMHETLAFILISVILLQSVHLLRRGEHKSQYAWQLCSYLER